jgi:mannonate dehydratase
MDRRRFITTSGIGAAAAAAGVLTSGRPGSSLVEAQAQRPGAGARQQILCRLGSNCNAYSEAELLRVGRFGVTTIVSGVQRADANNLGVTREDLLKMRELPEKHGIKVSVLTPPQLGSSHIDREANPYIMLGKSPERDREIEGFQTTIRNAAAAGIPCIKYNMSLLGVLRTGRAEGRADTSFSHSDLEVAKERNKTLALTRAGVVTADMYWERITYFLERVVPVANEYRVRLACHPNDSIVPDGGYQGIDPVLSRPEGLKRFVTIQDSPYHGLNLCLGVLSQMHMNPAEQIWEPLTWLASRKKIFNVHFRNIKGNRLKFSEVAPDEGEADFTRAVLVLAQNGYDGHITPDHNVSAEGDNTGGQAYTAFVYGYIAASIKAAGRQMNT